MVYYSSSQDTCNSNLIDDAIVSFDHIGFLPLSFFVLCGWFLLNKCYNSLIIMILSRMSIKESEVQRLLTVYWNISFTTITVPFALQALSIPFSDVIDTFYFNLDKNVSNWFLQEATDSKIRMVYILLTGFFLNKVCQISVEKGFKNIDFVITELFTVFFVSTFAYRCIRFGIAFMIVYNSVQSLLEFTRMLYCFSKIYPSYLASFFTKFVFLLHISLWAMVYMHIVPKYFLITTLESVINSLDDASHVLILILLNLALCGFYLLHVFSSPITTIICNKILQKPYGFESILFDTTPSTQLFELDVTQDVPTESSKVNESKQKSKENLKKVYQTIRCYIRIKRKLKHIREKLKENKDTLPHCSVEDIHSSISANGLGELASSLRKPIRLSMEHINCLDNL